MTYLGTVKRGRIELEEAVSLPEGTRVRVEPVQVGLDPADGLGDEAVESGIPDLASRHDHYIYGVPNQGSE